MPTARRSNALRSACAVSLISNGRVSTCLFPLRRETDIVSLLILSNGQRGLAFLAAQDFILQSGARRCWAFSRQEIGDAFRLDGLPQIRRFDRPGDPAADQRLSRAALYRDRRG